MRARLLNHKGFSLVELSIVLVILGLLVGGILAGQSLIRAAELRQVSSKLQSYKSSLHAFRDKYVALPGDMINATSFWGTQNPIAANCINSSSTDQLTCNGDGNGQIDVSDGSNEPFRLWQHLANAGLVEGTFTGVQRASYPGTMAVHIGVNVPMGPPAIGYFITYIGSVANSTYYRASYGNTAIVGGNVNGLNNYFGFMTPSEAWNIDTKIDDGRATSGQVMMYTPTNNPGCVSGWSSTTDSYVLSSTNRSCALLYLNII